ncbi:MAG: purD [Alphaproteobacteria bacterium]|nr:purD [Alphaproteobacteria bacterium]
MIGSGGREHALAWKLAQSPRLERLFAAPGNPGIEEHAEIVDLDPADHAAIAAFCDSETIGLVVIGPEAPLVAGLGDALRAAGIAVFGPNRIPASLEGSKGFTKDLCTAHDIATARYRRAASRAEAEAALAEFGVPVVIKADGLAAGKGVVIAAIPEEAQAALDMMFDGTFGDAGASVVIEEFLTGEEASVFALTDGRTILPFGSAQDHKRVGDGDVGPNTGGMGAYSPASIVTPEIERLVMDGILRPTVDALTQAGTPYSGILYAGLMLTETGPILIEYNARFGDPECQVLMMRLDQDLLELLLATAEGRLDEIAAIRLRDEVALTVVLAAKGYPERPEKGGAIRLGVTDGEAAKIFHAGTAMFGGVLVASGGRVLDATALGATITQARDRAYRAAESIDFPGGFYRSDIGWREIERG